MSVLTKSAQADVSTLLLRLATVTTIVEDVDYGDAVHFDPAGSTGTAWPIGTPTNPCSSIADVRTILTALNLHKIIVHGSLTLDATMQGYHFIGFNPINDGVTLDINSKDVDNSIFENLCIEGTVGGSGFYPYFKDCVFLHETVFQGFAIDCIIAGTLSMVAGAWAELWNPKEMWHDFTLKPGTASVYIYGLTGFLTISTMTGGEVYIYAHAGTFVNIVPAATGGSIIVEGVARVIDNNGGSNVQDNTDTTIINRDRPSMIFPSASQAIVVIPGAGADLDFPSVVVAGLPSGLSIKRVDFVLVIGGLLDTSSAENQIKTGTADKIFVKKSGDAWADGTPKVISALTFTQLGLQVDADAYRGGAVLFGATDIKGVVTADGTYNFRSEETNEGKGVEATAGTIELLDVSSVIRVWFN